MVKKILVVDDDKNICELVKLYLEKEGYQVFLAYDGIEGYDKFRDLAPDLMILDIMLPGADGWEVCRKIKKDSDVSIIMLSAKGETFDKVLGLELGADDYIVKPFEPKELVARVKAILRRASSHEKKEDVIKFENLLIDRNNYVVVLNEKSIEMPPKEFELLYYLASHPNQVLTRNSILESIWSYDFFGDSRTIDVHVKRIREKIEKNNNNWEIKTVWGVGYKFEVK
ncbi:MAG: response regulator transcription factor [Clostridiales bacterium]|nr:response regulator transcription factor [Clostridiales bacterium]